MNAERDDVIIALGRELRQVLIARGLDPKDPPTETPPPTAKVLGEYRRRGGDPTLDGPTVVRLLIEEVGRDD